MKIWIEVVVDLKEWMHVVYCFGSIELQKRGEKKVIISSYYWLNTSEIWMRSVYLIYFFSEVMKFSLFFLRFSSDFVQPGII